MWSKLLCSDIGNVWKDWNLYPIIRPFSVLDSVSRQIMPKYVRKLFVLTHFERLEIRNASLVYESSLIDYILADLKF